LEHSEKRKTSLCEANSRKIIVRVGGNPKPKNMSVTNSTDQGMELYPSPVNSAEEVYYAVLYNPE